MDNKLKLRNKALKLISYKEYSVNNLSEKLYSYAKNLTDDINKDDVNELLEEFEEKGWISDARAVECLVNQKSSRYGLSRMKIELKKLKVCENMVQSALSELASTEFKRAELVLKKKYYNPPVDYNESCKQKNYLFRRGFLLDVCYSVVNKRVSN